MNWWGFWVLLLITLLVLAVPFLVPFTPAASFTVWFFGSVLLLAVVMWIGLGVFSARRRQTE